MDFKITIGKVVITDQCSLCGKTLDEMTADNEDILIHAKKHNTTLPVKTT